MVRERKGASSTVLRLLDNVAYNIWQLLIVALVSYTSFTIPLSIVANQADRYFWLREIILTVCFTLDIFITQRRIQQKKTYLVSEYGLFSAYQKRWMAVDVIAAVPFALITSFPGLALIRLVKLVRVVNMLWVVRRIKVHLANPILLLQIIYWTAVAAHFLSCGWLLIRGFDHDTDIYSNYISALYWTTTTLTTVGYGDIVPSTSEERLYAIFTMILGYSLIGYLIGSIAGILTKKDPARERYLENLEKLSNAVKYAQLPLDLQQRIHAYYRYMMDRRVGYDEASFIEELPPGLRAEVSLHFRKEVIERAALFDEAPTEFVLEIAQYLRERIVPPGDYVFRAGDAGSDMFLIARGEINVYSPDETRLLASLKEGDFFGEIALFKNIPRTATVKATSYCDIYSLSKDTLESAFKKYPSIAERVRAKAEQRQKSDSRLTGESG